MTGLAEIRGGLHCIGAKRLILDHGSAAHSAAPSCILDPASAQRAIISSKRLVKC